MDEWKQAWQLSKIELKGYIPWLVLTLFMFVLLAFFLGASFPAYIDEHRFFKEQNPGLFDLAFLFLFGVVPYWMRPKDSRYQQISGDFYAAPFFIKLLQLPVPERVVIKSRFLTYLVQSLPFHLLFLIVFQLFAALQGHALPPVAFISFSIIWLSFGIYFGHSSPASDAGGRINTLKMFLHIILFGGIVLGAYYLIVFHSPYGVVAWTVLFATNWPLLSTIISILLAIAGMRFWMYYMKKTMNKVDYP